VLPELKKALQPFDERFLKAELWFEENQFSRPAPLPSATTAEAVRHTPAGRPPNPTDLRILAYCRRKAHKGERIAHHLGLSYDHTRRVLARLVKEGRLRNTDDGYRTIRAT
jgi:hypothetical protein